MSPLGIMFVSSDSLKNFNCWPCFNEVDIVLYVDLVKTGLINEHINLVYFDPIIHLFWLISSGRLHWFVWLDRLNELVWLDWLFGLACLFRLIGLDWFVKRIGLVPAWTIMFSGFFQQNKSCLRKFPGTKMILQKYST